MNKLIAFLEYCGQDAELTDGGSPGDCASRTGIDTVEVSQYLRLTQAAMESRLGATSKLSLFVFPAKDPEPGQDDDDGKPDEPKEPKEPGARRMAA